MSLSVAHQGSENEDALAVVFLVYHVQHILFGVFHHLLSRGITVGNAGTGIEQA